jgi:hypothetical protein
VNLPSGVLDLLHLLRRQIRQELRLRQLLDPPLVSARRNRNDALRPDPQVQRLRRVDFLTGLLRDTGSDALEDGLDRSAGLVTEERGKTAVGLGDDAVLLVDGEDLVDLSENVGVVL